MNTNPPRPSSPNPEDHRSDPSLDPASKWSVSPESAEPVSPSPEPTLAPSSPTEPPVEPDVAPSSAEAPDGKNGGWDDEGMIAFLILGFTFITVGLATDVGLPFIVIGFTFIAVYFSAAISGDKTSGTPKGKKSGDGSSK